jgi:hypothetical protein
VITAYRTRNVLEKDQDLALFEEARLNLMERAAREHGFEPARGTLSKVDHSVTDTLAIDVALDPYNNAEDNAEERLANLLYDLEDRDVGHLSFLYDTDAERRFLEGIPLSCLEAKRREEPR